MSIPNCATTSLGGRNGKGATVSNRQGGSGNADGDVGGKRKLFHLASADVTVRDVDTNAAAIRKTTEHPIITKRIKEISEPLAAFW